MIRGRTIYVLALIAIVPSLIISGCVTAPPKVTPTPTGTPAYSDTHANTRLQRGGAEFACDSSGRQEF